MINNNLLTEKQRRFFDTDLQVAVLKGYLGYYNSHKEYSKEQLYKDYYGYKWEHFYNEKTLDKYLEVA